MAVPIFSSACLQVVKGIDAVSRQEIGRFVISTGIYRLNPILSTMPLPGATRSISLIPTVTSEDEKVINNMRKVVEFLSAGTPAAKSLGQVGSISPTSIRGMLMHFYS